MALPPFSIDSVCPKCQIDNANYRPKVYWIRANDLMEEHMQRVCVVCGYSWNEAPLG